ncbi:PemK family transcriptional regulator [Candidatus Pacearchaeota archaeon]|jgi:mRNA interferase MazF|nr:PemK family transcriptional regulator [Candidatus Pacearchaeota archaeon]|tara:strand:+ start:4444 stop:4791 length:348 start_codon:yes stop_codon:yes gene_type:complete
MVGIKRGDIVIANLEPTKGNEQGGRRPVLIIQNNIGNNYSPTTIIAPITSNVFDKEFPTNVFVDKKDSKLNKNSTILLNQIRTIDKRRIIKKVGFLDNEINKKVDMAIKVSLDLD